MKDETVDFTELFRILWERKVIVVVTAAIGMAVAIAIAIKSPPMFRSTSKLLCKTGGSKASELAGLAALAGVNLAAPSTSDPSAYFNDVINDHEFLERILQRQWLVDGKRVTLESIWKLAPDTSKPAWLYRFKEARIERIRDGKYITLLRNPTNGLQTLTTVFESPELALQVNDTVISMLNDYVLNSLLTQAKQNRKFIESQLSAIESDLSKSESELAGFSERNLNVQSPSLLLQSTRLRRAVTLNQELFLQMKKQYELAKIEENKDQPLIEVISKPTLPIAKFKPNRKLIVMVGVGFGLILGTVLAFMQYWAGAIRAAINKRR